MFRLFSSSSKEKPLKDKTKKDKGGISGLCLAEPKEAHAISKIPDHADDVNHAAANPGASQMNPPGDFNDMGEDAGPPPPAPIDGEEDAQNVMMPAQTVPLTPEEKLEKEMYTQYGESSRYQVKEFLGRGSYGVVCSAVDTQTGELVAIKKIGDIFGHVADARRILREIKLLRLLRHTNIVELKHILLPPSSRSFKEIFLVFELLESDLHQVIKINHDLTPEHLQYFMYQICRAMKYVHSASVFHRDLKPKNILANSSCKLKVCDFGLARLEVEETETAVFWTDYVATRWYRAPELCGSFYARYSSAVDVWSCGCIFAELLLGKPLFPGKNVVHMLEMITDLLGSPDDATMEKIQNKKAKELLQKMTKPPKDFAEAFPKATPEARDLLALMLAFNPDRRPSMADVLKHPYFQGIANPKREPSANAIRPEEFDFETEQLSNLDIKELIYKEILEYHPKAKEEYLKRLDDQSHGMHFPSQQMGVGQAFLAIERGDRKVARQGQAINSLPVAEAVREAKPKFHLDSALPVPSNYTMGNVPE